MSMFRSRDLAVFDAVAQAGNITAGAECLHVSQPAVSKQIRELEERVGLPLFDRLPRGVRLTEAGQVVAGYATRAIALEREAVEALAALRGLEAGQLSIGASTTIGSYLLPPLLARFHHRHPGVNLNLVVANTSQIQDQLAAYQIDVGLTEGLLDSPELEATSFMDDELVPVCAPDWYSARRDLHTLSQLAAQPLIAREEGSGTRAVAERAFAEQGLRPNVLMVLGSTEAIKQMVMQGAGYALISRLAVAAELADQRLAEIPLEKPRICRTLHCVWARGRSASPAMKAFIAEVNPEARTEKIRSRREHDQITDSRSTRS